MKTANIISIGKLAIRSCLNFSYDKELFDFEMCRNFDNDILGIFKVFFTEFSNFESISRSRLEGFSEFIEKGFTNGLINVHPSVAINLFQKCKELLPKVKKP